MPPPTPGTPGADRWRRCTYHALAQALLTLPARSKSIFRAPSQSLLAATPTARTDAWGRKGMAERLGELLVQMGALTADALAER